MDELFPPTITDEIACVRREIVMRKRVYPRRVADGKMDQITADRELDLMNRVLARLVSLRETGNG